MPDLPQLALHHLTLLPAPPLELIDAAAFAGFDSISLRIMPPLPTDKITPVVGDVPLQREIKRRLSQTGLAVFDVEAFWLLPHTSIDNLKPALELGVELGAKYVLVVGNDPERSRLIDRFAALCSACAAFKLRPMLEFIPYSEVRSLSEARQFLTTSGASNAGILVDALHLSRSGGTPADIAQYPADLFSYIHLCDAPAVPPPAAELRNEARGGRLYPGEGELWLKDFIRAFPAGTPVAVETPSIVHGQLASRDKAELALRLTRDLFRSMASAAA